MSPENQPKKLLESAVGIDYKPLQQLLSQSQWKEADLETEKLMERAVILADDSEDYLESNKIQKVPSTDLRTIDKLWVLYSKGNFGFSVQKEIYIECGAKLNGRYPGDKVWNRFIRRVGWKVIHKWRN